MKIIITGGGTGGHVYPALAFINYLKAKEPDIEILYIGTRKGLEAKIIPEAEIPFQTVDIQGIKRSLALSNIVTAYKFFKSTALAKKIMRDFKPDIVLGTGGYVAGPVVYAATRLQIPTIIHEGNSYPGITNRFLAKRVTKIAVGFHAAESYFPKEKTVFTGNPRAQEVAEKARFFVKSTLPTVVIFGGSRGALTINRAFVEALPELAQQNFKVIYASGAIYFDDYKEIFANYQSNPHLDIRPYIENMTDLLSQSQLFLGRSGSTTIAEVTALGLPAIYIPSPNVTADQQTKNAMEYVENGAALLIKDSELTGALLVQSISEILENSVKYKAMHEASLLAGVPDASIRLWKVMQSILK